MPSKHLPWVRFPVGAADVTFYYFCLHVVKINMFWVSSDASVCCQLGHNECLRSRLFLGLSEASRRDALQLQWQLAMAMAMEWRYWFMLSRSNFGYTQSDPINTNTILMLHFHIEPSVTSKARLHVEANVRWAHWTNTYYFLHWCLST